MSGPSQERPDAPAAPAPPAAAGTDAALPEAEVATHRRRPFQVVWLVPVIAALVAGWLVWRTVSREGPRIVITFSTGQGITAGQTKVRHKAVDLGTVSSVTLSPDMQHVEVGVNMLASAEPILTSNAHFWVVRPRFTPGNISGLDTLFSGSFIEVDPGAPNGARQHRFVGLEEPPAVRSGEPGETFVLATDRIGSLSSGSPVFYRDRPAGEVLSADYNVTGTGAKVRLFIRSPYDRFVRAKTRFWNASGFSIDLGAQGLQVRIASLQAVLSGGIAFDNFDAPNEGPRRPPGSVFPLYDDEGSARSAEFATRIKLLVYFDGSVRGLSPGAPVEINGIQIGTVTDVRLMFDLEGASSRVAVRMEVQPQRFLPPDKIHPEDSMRIAEGLVAHGLRAQLSSSNLITGQMLVAFEFVPDAPPERARQEGDYIVLPSTSGGGLDNLTTSLAGIAHKLDALPLDQVVQNLDSSLHGASTLLNGPDLRHTIASIDEAARRFPALTQHLDQALGQIDRLVASASQGYGDGSLVNRDLSRTLEQVSDAARSIRLLADYLSIHPEALIRGRVSQATER